MNASGEKTRFVFAQYKCCVIIPTYNNGKTLTRVIEGCLDHCPDVLIINDGSTDETATILSRFDTIRVHTISPNGGKGAALRKAFTWAHKLGFDYAVTIDSDGQHDPEDLSVFANALEQEQGPVYIGARNMGQRKIPLKSSFGHRNSNFWFWVETGIKAEDTQSGYRLYPLAPLSRMKLLTWKYEFEIEVIVRAAWKDVPVKWIPVRVYYPEDRVTHFRPFRDFTRVALLNVALVFLAFAWYRPLQMVRALRKKTLRQIWRDHILKPGESPERKAFAVAAGLFSGISPFWGLHTFLAVGFAFLFRLNKPLTILASNVSIPPMIPLVLYTSYGVGGLLNGSGWNVSRPEEITFEVVYSDIFRYFTGAMALAIGMAAVGWVITWVIALSVQRKKPMSI